jgi:hypothetical protein
LTHTSGRGSLFVFLTLGDIDMVGSGGGTPNSGPPVEQWVLERFAARRRLYTSVCLAWVARFFWMRSPHSRWISRSLFSSRRCHCSRYQNSPYSCTRRKPSAARPLSSRFPIARRKSVSR